MYTHYFKQGTWVWAHWEEGIWAKTWRMWAGSNAAIRPMNSKYQGPEVGLCQILSCKKAAWLVCSEYGGEVGHEPSVGLSSPLTMGLKGHFKNLLWFWGRWDPTSSRWPGPRHSVGGGDSDRDPLLENWLQVRLMTWGSTRVPMAHRRKKLSSWRKYVNI